MSNVKSDREPVTTSTTAVVRVWHADAEWLRTEAFERRVPRAVVVADALAAYRAAEKLAR